MNLSFQNQWLEYSDYSWKVAGRPEGLNPRNIIENPQVYDNAYYDYFYQKYFSLWYSIYNNVAPNTGIFIKKENPYYKKSWESNFNWDTIWKQTLPLLAYGTVLEADHDILINLASWYCIGQAIPSMVVDRVLDNDRGIESNNSDIAFCFLCYIKSLKGIKKMNVPNSDKLIDTYLDYTFEMYEKMFIEHFSRFKISKGFISEEIEIYLSSSSRLLSSIFFGVLPIWAHTITKQKQNTQLNDEAIKSFACLRMVRQLNDEVKDVKEDLLHGLITLPWLYAIEEKPELKNHIKDLWQSKNKTKFITKCYQLLENTNARKRSLDKSFDLLTVSMKSTMNNFNKEKGFDISLLHNIRWAYHNWLIKENYNLKQDEIYKIEIPEKILHSSKVVEPIAGGGVLVYNSSKHIMLTLVLKRGLLRWEIPAGMSKINESIEETAIREFKEETGKNFDILIGKTIATCWHYSEKINKGWMGLFFEGKIENEISTEYNKLTILKNQAFSINKFNMNENPELYQLVDLKDCDFDKILDMCNFYFCSTVHEVAIASGFVDWKKIPKERLHPLHRKLLQSLEDKTNSFAFLYANADEDILHYDNNSKLYFNL